MKDNQAPAFPLWKDKIIVDPTHAHDLERDSAILEFESKLPREQAEEMAYKKYKKMQHAKAAANHFAGMQAAKAAGEKEDVKKHYAMYAMHLGELGFKPTDALPFEVEHHLHEAKSEPHYSFHAHKADAFLMNDGKSVKKSIDSTTAAGVMNHAQNTWKMPPPKDPSKYTPVGTLKEGAYMRARDSQPILQEEVVGAMEHAHSVGDAKTYTSLAQLRMNARKK